MKGGAVRRLACRLVVVAFGVSLAGLIMLVPSAGAADPRLRLLGEFSFESGRVSWRRTRSPIWAPLSSSWA